MKITNSKTALSALFLALGASGFHFPTLASAQSTALEALNVVYGPHAPSREGDIDKLERLYISVPADTTGPLYLRVFDPEYGGPNDTIQGRSNSKIQFRFWGGDGAFTAPPRPAQITDGARAPRFDIEAPIAEPGEMLFERVFDSDQPGNGQWVTFTEFEISAGEQVGDRRYFRLDVRGIAGDDGNAFVPGISQSPTSNRAPADVRIEAYDPTVRWPGFDGPVQARFTAPADGRVTIQTFDAAGAKVALQTHYEDIALRASGQDNWASETVTVSDRQIALTIADGFEKPNDVTIGAFDSAGDALPFLMPITRADIIDRPEPIATAQPLSNCVSVAFDASASTGADEIIYDWDFGDGTTSDRPVIVHSYTEPGQYEAILSILDARSNVPRGNRLRLPVHVRNAPLAIPGEDILVAPGQEVAFNGTTSEASDSPITWYSWAFGDGKSAQGAEVQSVYDTPGVYRAVLRVEDDSAHPCNFGLATRIITVNAPPVAEAGTDQTSIVGAVLAFDGSASYDVDGTVQTYNWDMGDGTVLSGPRVSHAFLASGTYTVKLTTVDDSGVSNHATQDTLTVIVNAPPEPAITPLDRPIAVGEVANLSAAASRDPDGDIVTYVWDFGDGAVAEGPEVQYAWTSPGAKTVRLLVTDNSGTPSAEQSTTLDVVVSAAPVSDAGPDQMVTASMVHFDGGASADPDGEISSYQWAFGDGATASGAKVSHAYRAPGVYEVTLVVRDDSGAPLNVALDTAFVTINATPLADAGPDRVVTPGQPVLLDASFSVDPDGQIGETLWTLPSGEIISGQRVETSFDTAGLYRVGLEVRDTFEGGSAFSFDEVLITVNAQPVAVIGPNLLVEPGVPVTFDGSQSYDTDGAIAEYRWDFDDLDQPEFGQTVTRVFDEPGVVSVQLTVTDESGALNATQATDISVRVNHAPVADAGLDIYTDGLSVSFDGTGSSDGDGDALMYMWDFGDGSAPAQGRSPKHIFPRPGKYPVTVRVDDGTGLGNATASDTLVVVIDSPPVAVAGGNRDVCSGDPILFDATGSLDPDGGRLSYAWDFGDGSSSDIVNPNKIYEQPGTYPVTLTVRDESGSPLGVDIDRIAALVREGPIAQAGADIRACTNQNVRFDGSGSSDADGAVNAFRWTFGDGESASGETPVHSFSEAGTYTVTLTITGDAQGQCSPADTDQMVVVVEAAPDLSILSDDIMAAGVKNTFTAVLTGSNSKGADLRWTFSDGSTYEGETVRHAFSTPGEYLVTVDAKLAGNSADCGLLSTDRRISVNAAPVAAFEGPKAVAIGVPVTFDASAASDPDGALTSYAWNFGNGETGTGLTASHVFTQAGRHKVTLTVQDDSAVENSTATLSQDIIVNPGPVAGLENTPPLCVGVVNQWASGFGPNVDATWHFGDGAKGSGPEVQHAFAAPGVYPVLVKLDDGEGLTNSQRVEEIYARVNAAPIALAGPDRTVNPGDPITFSASGSGDIDGAITSYLWTFSDGVELEGADIVRQFDVPGSLTATLTVIDDSGAMACNTAKDSATILVNNTPVVDAGADLTIPIGGAHDVIIFDASAASDPDGHGLKLAWDFGDGSVANGARVEHRYAVPGVYTVTVTAQDSTGLSSGIAMDTATVTALAR